MCQIISAKHLGLTLFKTTSVHSILTQVKREAVLNESDDSSGVYLPSNAVSPFVHQLDQCIVYTMYTTIRTYHLWFTTHDISIEYTTEIKYSNWSMNVTSRCLMTYLC